jgi:hypothetical protein
LTDVEEFLYVARSVSITYLYPILGFFHTARTEPVALDHMGIVDSGEEPLITDLMFSVTL